MYSHPWDPIGHAIHDFHNGVRSVSVLIYSDFEEPVELQASYFFREPAAFPALEQTALSLCRGRVLDIGAGAGCHTLALQEMGFDVSAIDVDPGAVDVMKARGVRDAECSDAFTFSDGHYDTLLLLMNGIGIVGDPSGLAAFLRHAHQLATPDCRLVFDSLDLRETCTDAEIAARQADPSREYFGVVRYQVEYRGRKGPWYSWLYIDTLLLNEIVSANGWTVEAIYPDENGRYLALLTQS
jgi:SAM-dependent methyltransferase